MPGINTPNNQRSMNFILIVFIAALAGSGPLSNIAEAADPAVNEAQEIESNEARVNAVIDKTLGDHRAYKALLQDLKGALIAGNRQHLADLMSYPLDASIDENPVTVSGAAMFLAFYDKIMTPEIVSAIENTAYADVIVSYQGVTLGDGQVWINSICKNEGCSEVEVLVSSLSNLNPPVF